MAKFHFNGSSSNVLDDEEATELPDPGAVRQHARTVASELMYHCDGMLGRPWREWSMTVTDDQGNEVLSFHFAEATEQAKS